MKPWERWFVKVFDMRVKIKMSNKFMQTPKFNFTSGAGPRSQGVTNSFWCIMNRAFRGYDFKSFKRQRTVSFPQKSAQLLVLHSSPWISEEKRHCSQFKEL